MHLGCLQFFLYSISPILYVPSFFSLSMKSVYIVWLTGFLTCKQEALWVKVQIGEGRCPADWHVHEEPLLPSCTEKAEINLLIKIPGPREFIYTYFQGM